MSDDWNKLKHLVDLSAENARLKEEVERLDDLCKKLGKQHSDISCENIRLRKAGDELSNALAAFHLIHRGKIDTTTQPDIVAWNAAKEGKQP